MINVSIIGSSGYAGIELFKILKNHPEVNIVNLVSKTFQGKEIGELYPKYRNLKNMKFVWKDYKDIAKESKLIFTATPHKVAMEFAKELYKEGVVLIDLSADFRFEDYKVFERWYKVEHKSKELLPNTVYGLPELYREKIKNANLIGNPGCYPTASILGLAPLIKHKLINTESIIIDAKSGTTGAGKKLSESLHFSERNENLSPYSPTGHRHIPEIEKELCKIGNLDNINITFTPHLVPMDRGILTTIYARLTNNYSEEKIYDIYKEFYSEAYFVRIVEENLLPDTKSVTGTNFCDIAIRIDKRTNRIIVFSAIDNLIKGASGQAVQNMNIIFGFKEELSLT
jgi:N-acetyl-gamma-glutamyl-phosphate reductase